MARFKYLLIDDVGNIYKVNELKPELLEYYMRGVSNIQTIINSEDITELIYDGSWLDIGEYEYEDEELDPTDEDYENDSDES